MFKVVVAFGILVGLSGCISGKRADNACREMGAQPGTDIYVQCRMTMQAQYRRDMSEASDALLAYGASGSSNRVHCTTTRTGIFTNTDCY